MICASVARSILDTLLVGEREGCSVRVLRDRILEISSSLAVDPDLGVCCKEGKVSRKVRQLLAAMKSKMPYDLVRLSMTFWAGWDGKKD